MEGDSDRTSEQPMQSVRSRLPRDYSDEDGTPVIDITVEKKRILLVQSGIFKLNGVHVNVSELSKNDKEYAELLNILAIFSATEEDFVSFKDVPANERFDRFKRNSLHQIKNGISWKRIASLMVSSAKFSKEFGDEELTNQAFAFTLELIKTKSLDWIIQSGGWASLTDLFKEVYHKENIEEIKMTVQIVQRWSKQDVATFDGDQKQNINEIVLKLGSLADELNKKQKRELEMMANMAFQEVLLNQNYFNEVATRIFKTTINWGKIVAFFAFVSYCLHRVEELLMSEGGSLFNTKLYFELIRIVMSYVFSHLLNWITESGGWQTLKSIAVETQGSLSNYMDKKTIFAGVVVVSIVLSAAFYMKKRT